MLTATERARIADLLRDINRTGIDRNKARREAPVGQPLSSSREYRRFVQADEQAWLNLRQYLDTITDWSAEPEHSRARRPLRGHYPA